MWFQHRTLGRSFRLKESWAFFLCNCNWQGTCRICIGPGHRLRRVWKIGKNVLSRGNTKWNKVQAFWTVVLIIRNRLSTERTRGLGLRRFLIYRLQGYLFNLFQKLFRNLEILIKVTCSLYSLLRLRMAQLYASPFISALIHLITVVVSILPAWAGNWTMFLETLLRSNAVSAWRSILATRLIAMMYEWRMESFFYSSSGTGTLAFLISW